MTCFSAETREAFVWGEPRGAMSLVSLELDEKDKAEWEVIEPVSPFPGHT